jgi:hypothetical protein
MINPTGTTIFGFFASHDGRKRNALRCFAENEVYAFKKIAVFDILGSSLIV